jgi:Type IV secretion system pilin/Lysozyme like domain
MWSANKITHLSDFSKYWHAIIYLSMKKLTATLFLFLLAFSAAPSFAQQDTFTPPTITNGTIDANQGFVPCSGTTCGPCDLLVLFNTLLKWFMGIAFLIFAILAMKAGVTMVVSGSSGSLEAAKKSFTNAFIGLIIILSAWLIVDTLMRGLIGGNGDIKVSNWGPWAAVRCDITQAAVGEQAGFFDAESWAPGDIMVPGSNVPYSGGPLGQCSAGNGACSPSSLAGVGMTPTQAAIMSCIAMTESSGNSSLPAYYQTHPKSSACGTFQIIQKTWERTATGNCASFSQCTNAACNAQVATKLVQSSSYGSWTCKDCNNKASHCVSQYGG